jgi:hypothetical protein
MIDLLGMFGDVHPEELMEEGPVTGKKRFKVAGPI